MAPKKRPWFRFYVETFSDLELRVLSPALRWTWAALMGLARSSPVAGVLLDKAGAPLTEGHIADFAAVKVSEVRTALRQFEALGMLARDGDALHLANWDARQFESDDVTARTAKHRARNVPSNDDGTALGTESPSVGLYRGSEEQNVPSSSGSPSTDPFDDEGAVGKGKVNPVNEAMAVLAARDLERVEADKGPRGDRTAWLTTATQRRWDAHVVDAERILKAQPGLTGIELANVLEPHAHVAAKAAPNPLDETQRAERAAQEAGLPSVRALLNDPGIESDPEKRKAQIEANRAARKSA